MVEPITKSISGKLPKIGVNTRRLRGDECSEKVLGALKSGVRLVDTAQAYGNEFEVGQAVQNSEVPREDITVITKVQITDYRPYDLLWSVRESLDRLRVDHVDVLVLHGVHPNLGLDRTLDALQEAKSRGLTESIGVADFSATMFREASEKTNGALCCNQIEYHPFIDRDAELAGCKGLLRFDNGLRTACDGRSEYEPGARRHCKEHRAYASSGRASVVVAAR